MIVAMYNQIAKNSQRLLRPGFLLFLRLWVSWVFLKSGLLKISNWDSTLYLFEEEYQVPLLSYELAAYLGTATELIIPVFLVLGLATRFSALILFVFNIIAVWSYPVLAEGGFSLLSQGAMDHQIWGLMLVLLLTFGAGKLSVDRYSQKLI